MILCPKCMSKQIACQRVDFGCRCKHKGSWLWFPLSLDACTPILYEVAGRHFSYFTPEQIFTDPDWLGRGGFTNLQLFKTITLEPAP